MNRSMLRYIIGRILIIFSLLLLVPAVVALIYREGARVFLSFFGVALLSGGLGFVFGREKPTNTKFYAKEGLVICALSWILFSVLGGLPMVLAGDVADMVDATFEAASGFTTTGSSILANVDIVSRATVFWRSFSHLVGGMGVLVFALAVLPSSGSESVHVMKAEVPGPVFGKLVSKLRTTARLLYAIYLVMTAVLVVLLYLGGMTLFDSLIYAFGAAGTGGFSGSNAGIAAYDSAYLDVVLGVAMLLFGVNFNLYYLILIRRVRQALCSEELRWYVSFVVIAVALICFNVLPLYGGQPLRMLRDVFFTVSSIITTTGYATADFGSWPLFSHVVLLLLMFFGACAGSTAGGLKTSRVVILMKNAKNQIFKIREPKRAIRVRFDGKMLCDQDVTNVSTYFQMYMIIFAVLVLLVSVDAPDFLTAFSAVAATFNNIGPGLGMVGPTSSFASLSHASKLILTFSMLAGRLEIFPILTLFMPSTWAKHR